MNDEPTAWHVAFGRGLRGVLTCGRRCEMKGGGGAVEGDEGSHEGGFITSAVRILPYTWGADPRVSCHTWQSRTLLVLSPFRMDVSDARLVLSDAALS
jgi:hypothetical protein